MGKKNNNRETEMEVIINSKMNLFFVCLHFLTGIGNNFEVMTPTTV